jgi:hypothetical protein
VSRASAQYGAGHALTVVPSLQKYLHIKLTDAQTTRITEAAARAAGQAYGFMVQAGANLNDVPVKTRPSVAQSIMSSRPVPSI